MQVECKKKKYISFQKDLVYTKAMAKFQGILGKMQLVEYTTLTGIFLCWCQIYRKFRAAGGWTKMVGFTEG